MENLLIFIDAHYILLWLEIFSSTRCLLLGEPLILLVLFLEPLSTTFSSVNARLSAWYPPHLLSSCSKLDSHLEYFRYNIFFNFIVNAIVGTKHFEMLLFSYQVNFYTPLPKLIKFSNFTYIRITKANKSKIHNNTNLNLICLNISWFAIKTEHSIEATIMEEKGQSRSFPINNWELALHCHLQSPRLYVFIFRNRLAAIALSGWK